MNDTTTETTARIDLRTIDRVEFIIPEEPGIDAINADAPTDALLCDWVSDTVGIDYTVYSEVSPPDR